MAEVKYRVFNKCKYNIGVVLANGQKISIRAGSFQLMSADDISYTESVCTEDKYFAQRMLVPYDGEGNEVNLSEMGMYIDVSDTPHLSDDEIRAMLKQSVKKLEAWLANIEDPAELHGIYEVAKGMDDLPANKLRVLNQKMPNKDFIN